MTKNTIQYDYDYEENTTIQMLDNIWYIHPLYSSWAASENGEILYIAKRKVLMPKPTTEGLVIYVSSGHGFKLYLVHNFVREVFNDIEEVIGKVKHKDGNLANNSINNLELVTDEDE